MKFSVKIQDKDSHQLQPLQQQKNQNRQLLFRAKIPITIFNLPFLSGFSTASHQPSDLSLSLSSNFPCGPTLKLSYSSTTTTTTPPRPFTLTLRSGIGLYGSPKDSPLIISANFSFSPNNPTSHPTFSLLFKPQLGSFSLRKSTFSDPPGSPAGKINGEGANSFGFVPVERPVSLKDFSVQNNGKDSIFKGISMMARTEMPVSKRVLMNLRWGVNFPEDLSQQLPYLAVNKIGIERVDEVKEGKEVKGIKSEGNVADSELLKGMCLWMKRELDMLQRENREMRLKLEEMRLGQSRRNGGSGVSEVNRKRITPVVEESSGFEQWRSKKHSGEENSKKEVKKSGNRVSDVESELQRAIKAASSSS